MSSLSEDLEYRFHDRASTYKSYEAARRSFWKWVAKKQLYYPLRWTLLWRHNRHEHWDWERRFEPGFTSYHFGNGWGPTGLPAFRSWRSEAYSQWNREFERHLDEWRAKEMEKRKARQWAFARRELHSNTAVVETLRVLAAVGSLKK